MNRLRTMPLFLAASLAVHGMLLVAWHTDRTRPSLDQGDPVLGETQLRVTLPVPTSSDVRTPAVRNTNANTMHGSVTTLATPARTDVRNNSPGQPLQETRDGLSSPSARNALLGRVRTELARHFYYPRLARERGWEGQVVLGFSLLADGHLDHIHIAQSSGYHVLDESAREALGKVAMIVDAKRWIQGHGIDMQLPVIYRLLDR